MSLEILSANASKTFSEAAQYVGSDALKALWYMLNDLDRLYSEDMRSAETMEALRYKVGAQDQVRALKGMIDGSRSPHAGPPRV